MTGRGYGDITGGGVMREVTEEVMERLRGK